MNPDNRWVKKAEMIPWETIEAEYAKLFPSYTGMPAKPLRMALGSLLIQKQYHYLDEELVEQIRENPYYQYFIGLPGYEDKIPFVPSLLVEFRKRLSEDVLNEINEMIIEYNAQKNDDDSDDDDHDGNANSDTSDHQDETNESENAGTLILDATCAPQNIKYPQDIELLNETREKLEDMICRISEEYGFYRPRMYRQKARKDYLALAKCRKRGAKKIRKAIRKQLQYIRRDLGYIANLLENNGVVLSESDAHLLDILETVYSQQQYMFDNHTHSVENRIVSISQPYIRPIVRGKSKSPVEFGAKQRRRSPIRTIQIELKLSGNSVSQNGNSVLVCCLRKGRYHKSIDCSQHNCNEHRPSCGDAFAPYSVSAEFRAAVWFDREPLKIWAY